MGSLSDAMSEYRAQMQKGVIQQAYRGLMDYMSALKTELKAKHPDYQVSGSLYFGYMDMTYFAFTPPALKEKGLKIAIVFVHETFAFEAWLSAANRGLLAQFAEQFKDADWKKISPCKRCAEPGCHLGTYPRGRPGFQRLAGFVRSDRT